MVDQRRLHWALRDPVQSGAGACGTDGVVSEVLDVAVGVLGCRGCGVVLRGTSAMAAVPLPGYGPAVVALLLCWNEPHRPGDEGLEVAWLRAAAAAGAGRAVGT